MTELSCAKQRERWFLKAIEEIEQCVQSLTCHTAARQRLPVFEYQNLQPLNHFQRFHHQQMVQKERQLGYTLKQSLALLKDIQDGIQLDYAAQTVPLDPYPRCELKRCAVYSQFFPEMMPFALWTLVADYADHHSWHNRTVVIATNQTTLTVQLKCWCQLGRTWDDIQFLTSRKEYYTSRSTLMECDQLTLTRENTVIFNISSIEQSQNHQYIGRLGTWTVVCPKLVYDLFMMQKAWNQDLKFPGIENML